MPRVAHYCVLTATLCVLGLWSGTLLAVVPSQTLLPATTKGHFSILDFQDAKVRWNATQLGQLVNDPAMQPFVKDLGEQIEGKRAADGVRLGVSLEDLQAVAGGEVAWAVIQPGGDARQHARVLVADVTGHRAEAEQLLAQIGRNLVAQKAERSSSRVGAVEVVAYRLPRRRDQLEQETAYHMLHGDLLVTADHGQVAREVAERLQGAAGQTLDKVPAYQVTMRESLAAMGSQEAHVKWFVEPFGYMEVSRVMRRQEKRRGTDLLKVLRNQGFDAIVGVGGQIALKTDEHEILHRTLIYAPGQPGAESRFQLAARMLEFPNGPTVAPQGWVPPGIASYLNCNWNMQDAFEYSKTLVNELAGAKAGEDLFEDILGSIRDDVAGPRVDLRTALVDYLGQRGTLITDYRTPITPQSERLLVAVELRDAAKVAETIQKIMEADPDAEPRMVEGHVVWEIINEKPVEVEEIKIVGAGFGPFDGPEEEDDEEEEPILPNMAVAVAHGHLFVASHVDFVGDVLKQAREKSTLGATDDYVRIDKALEKLGAGQQSFQFFSRTDEAYRPTYELMKQGKMPESETMLGKILNRMMGPDEKGVVRKQEIDGAKMPDFDQVKHYLGPAGLYITTRDDGWLVSGCLLTK